MMHPDWLLCAWPSLAETDRAALLACERIQSRLQRLVADRLGWPDGPPVDGPLAALANLPASVLETIAGLAGAAWHAGSVRLVLNAAEVEALVEVIGAQARSFALEHMELSVAPAARTSVANLGEQIAAASRTCLAAWLAALPPGPRRLALPNFSRAFAEADMSPVDRQAALHIMAAAAPVVLDAA